ncbi:MAG: hypothetical protein COA85_13795 [Robiginitomaculum sp.]|nr:MAG: hypothetical protein COA85_13795 [Robiginitomaculum sp.]
MFKIFKDWKWTPWRAVFLVLLGWGVLLIGFAPWQICKPVFSTTCMAHAWNFVGEAVWLTGLKEWQALVAGIMALGAAILAAYYLKQQIQQTEKHERERWRRQLEAERAGLPDMLMSFADYLENCAVKLRDLRLACKGERLPRGANPPTFPLIPMEVSASFRRMVEVGCGAIAPTFKTLLSENQVFSARCRPFNNSSTDSDIRMLFTANNIDNYIANAVRLHAIAMSLFPYARSDTDEIPTKKMVASQYFTSFQILGFDGDLQPKTFEVIRDMVKRDLGTDKDG